ncbi:UNVERIFIED_CONTAM: hypothetical protein Scaly_0283200 [Sesamum calycinum]|uniref:PB1-like domain-containing protein n=1 Tax=Sesamum calycinum TaxID=2727403 RepID=A0AAW2SC14_9LAMI
MGWRLREGESEIATGRVAPDYGPNSEYFTIRLHHSGQLCEFGRRVYVGGKIDHFDYCHVDEMSLIELTEMAKTLQIDTEHVTFFYSRKVYNHLMMPLLGPEEWPHSDRPTLLPPISERMPGRPKKQDRRKTLDEMKNKKDEVTNCGEKRGKLGRQGLVMTCKTCHVAGHNKRTCPQNRKNKQPEEHVEVPPGFKPKKEKRKADVLSQESKLTTSRRPLTRSVAAQNKEENDGHKQGKTRGHNSPSTQQKKKKKTIENVAAASPSKNAASADPSKITVPASLSKTAASASPSKAPILASHSKTTAPASLSKTTASARHSKAPISASHSKTTASAGHAASPSPSTAANQDIHFELPPGCSQQ